MYFSFLPSLKQSEHAKNTITIMEERNILIYNLWRYLL
nr:MAG TPA: hypothetical protein [Caudoviricetes sp.]